MLEYPLSASITREYMVQAGTRSVGVNMSESAPYPPGALFPETPTYRHFYALKNRLNFYGTRSEHYKVSSSYGDKALQTVNLISIPSIFFGTRIKPGSVSLKWYFTGSLAAEVRDTRHNGELIEVSLSLIHISEPTRPY